MPPKQAVRLTNSAFYDGTLVVGTTAMPINARLVITEILLQAGAENQDVVYVGNATSQSMRLAANATEVITIDETSKVYVRGASEWQRVNWHAVGR